MVPLVLLQVLACGALDSEPSGAEGFPDLTEARGDRSIPLHRTPGRFTVEAPSLPGLAELEDTFVLEVEEIPNRRGVDRTLKVLRSKLPFNVPAGKFAPPGLSVTIDGEPIPFARGKAANAKRSTWRVNGRHLVLSHPTVPEPGTVVIRYSGIRKTLRRQDLALSELPVQEFVRADLTVGAVTRHGLVLPAPTTAEWDLTLPPSATTLDTWLALDRAPLPEPVPDPATLVITVVDGEDETEVGRQVVTRDDAGFTPLSADLAPWAGKDITLRLQTEPGENPWFDQVFVAAPTIRATSTDPRRVVVLAMDTTRPDHLGFYGYGDGATPELDRIGTESVAFERAWSVAPRTRPAFRSAATGRLPLDAVGQPNVAELFQEDGFATAGIVANVHLQPRFDFDHGFDWWHYDNNADAQVQVDRALEWLTGHQAQDSFLFLHLMDPHMPYRAPGEFAERFVTEPDPTLPQRYDHWAVNKWTARRQITDQRKAHIEALHDGEMAYMSQQIGRFVEQLDELPGRTLLVVHTDHGEEFWDHGAFEHNHQLYDETTRVILWFRPGGGLRDGHRVATPASLIDIAPTLTHMAGLEDTPVFDGISLAPVLNDPAAAPTADRPLPVAYNQYQLERWGVVFRDHKYILWTWTGREELYDLGSDPDEQKDLAATAELAPYREALATAHGVPVHPGLRIHVDWPGLESLEITLPDAPLDAGILDPEVGLAHRANQEWGEPPRRVAEDFGTLDTGTERTTLHFHPGPNPKNGVIWTQHDADIDASAVTLRVNGEPLELAQTPDGLYAGTPEGSVRVVSGTVLVPPPGEAARMRALRGDQGVDASEMEKLRDLGYVAPGEENE